MRPRKARRIECEKGERFFVPVCLEADRVKRVVLSLAELEALRLASLKGMKHKEAAILMGISRPTFSRTVTSVCRKVSDALVNIKAVSVESEKSPKENEVGKIC